MKTKEAVLSIVKKSEIAVTTDYVAFQLGISWNTAKCYLLELALEREITGIETTKGWVFIK